jgi:predicted transposase YbfD/YdcC
MQVLSEKVSVLDHFSNLPDPRVERCRKHLLLDIITIAICAVISGADSFVEMQEYGEAKQEWLSSFLSLENGIPSHDTFRRVFGRMKVAAFEECFLSWIEAIATETKGKVIAIDGKTLRRSFDRASGQSALHLVSAWAAENRLCLGQVKTEEKSNEITAIPELLKILELSGAIVTIDAMGCQKDICKQIVDQGAEYVISLKGNQGNLHKEVEDYFVWARAIKFKELEHSYAETVEKDHGRIQKRRCWSVDEIDWMQEAQKWKGLRSICAVELESEDLTTGKVSVETRYFISSLQSNAAELLKAVRGHWGVENSLHWNLDISFREDECRIRKDNGAENFAILRKIALNLLKQEQESKVGIKVKRNKAAWNNEYLLKILTI